MRFKHLLLFPLGHTLANAHLIHRHFRIRDPTWPEDTTAALSPTPTSPAQILEKCAACQVVGQALNVCASLSPRFTALDTSAQARCLCYSSTVWEPNVFDNAVESCANCASTAAPPAYGALSNLENFCQIVGNVNRPTPVFTQASTSGGGIARSGFTSSYVALTSAHSPSPAMTGYVGVGATDTAASGSGPGSVNTGSNASQTTNDGQGTSSSSPSKTISTDITMTAGGCTGRASSSVARKVIPEEEIIWLGFAISLACFFL